MAKKMANGCGHLDRKKRNGKPYGNWLIRYRVPGQQKPDYVNLETTDYNRACELYHEWIAKRKTVQGLQLDPNQTFRDFIRNWYDKRVRDQAQFHDVTKQTLVRYHNIAVAMEAYLEANNLDTLTLANLKSEVFQNFLKWRITQGRFHGVSKTVTITEAGANKEWRHWRGILRKAFQDRLLSKDVTKGVKPFTVLDARVPLPTEAEIQEAFGLFDPGEKFLVEFLVFLLNTGARPGEGMHLHWKDLDFDNRSFRIRHDGDTGWTTKTKGSWRQVPMPEVVERVFKQIRARRPGAKPEDYVFMNEATGSPLHRHEDLAYKRLDKAVRQANRQRKANGQSPIPVFSVRTLRAWFITWAMTRAENPLCEAEVIRLVGHVDFEMLRKHYFRLDMSSSSAQKMRKGGALGGCVLSSMLVDEPEPNAKPIPKAAPRFAQPQSRRENSAPI